MGKNIFKIFTAILVIILFASLTLGIINFAMLNNSIDNGSIINSNEEAKYHFMVIIDGTNTSYTDEFKEGMLKACQEYNAAVEFWNITGNDKMEQILKQIDIASESQVDGIVVYAYANDEFTKTIKKAIDSGIPVVTVNDDIPENGRITHVGVNEFIIGSEIGKILNNKKIEQGSIIVLQRDASVTGDETKAEENNLIVLGINDTLVNSNDFKVISRRYSGESVLSAEEVAKSVLDEFDDLGVIVCTNGQDALGVVEVLTDFNKISDIEVISYDDAAEIIDYIEKNVVTGTVITDYQKIGYDSIRDLYEYKEYGIVETNSYISTKLITNDNIDAYKGDLDENVEKN